MWWEEDYLYRHKNNRDVAFEVVYGKIVPDEQGRYELYVSWWNIGSCHAPWPMGISQTIRIKRDDVHNWNKMAIYERGPKPYEQTFSTK